MSKCYDAAQCEEGEADGELHDSGVLPHQPQLLQVPGHSRVQWGTQEQHQAGSKVVRIR